MKRKSFEWPISSARFTLAAAAGLVAVGAVLGALVELPSSVAMNAAQPETQPETQPEEGGPEDKGGMGAGMAMGMKMIAGLKASEGCLGVEMGRMMSGKMSIFAWFENKAAVKDWYYGVAHERLLDDVMPADKTLNHEPLAFVEDETIPILVVATMTFAEEPKFEAIKMPISQVSVELFAALPGGAQLGGRLSPEAFVVPHMVDLAK